MFTPKNPSWEHVTLKCFLAFQGKDIVGRIAVIIQKQYNEKVGGKFARFTRYDFIDNHDVAEALMDAAIAFAKEQGMEVMHGPLGFNDLDREGMLIDGFDKISTFETQYNYAYYGGHMNDMGFEKEADWLEFEIPIPKGGSERFQKIQSRMMDRMNLHVLPPQVSIRKTLKLYAAEIFDLLNTAYAPLHGYVEITAKSQAALIKQFKMVIKRDYLCLVFNDKNKLIGFGFGIPSIARSVNKAQGRMLPFGWVGILREIRHPKVLDMGLIAVCEEYKGKGVNAIIMNILLGNCIKNGIESTETNLELEDNAAILNQTEGFDRRLIKRRRCYIKKINQEKKD